MKIQPKILLTILVALLATGFFIGFIYRSNERSLQTQNWVNHTNNIIEAIDDSYADMAQTESDVRGFAISGDSAFLANNGKVVKRLDSVMGRIHQMLRDNPAQLARFEAYRSTANKKLALQDEIILAAVESEYKGLEIVSSLKGKILMDTLRSLHLQMNAEQKLLLAKQISENRDASHTWMRTSIIGALFSLFFVISLLLLLNIDISLRKKAEEITRINEEKFRLLIENSRTVLFTSNLHGNFTYVSPQSEELTGYSCDQLLAMNFIDLIDPAHAQEVAAFYLNQAKENILEQTYEFPVIRKNGERLWVEQESILLYSDGLLTGFQCFTRDINQRKIVEAELQRAESEQKEFQYKIQAILDNIPAMMYVKDLEGRYTLVNKRFRETFLKTDEMLIGKTIYDISNADSGNRYDEADKKVIETGQPVEVEDTITLPDGVHHLLTIKFPLYDTNQKLFGISGIGKDVTEMVQYRQDLILARRKAEQAERLQEQFLANMSHEIRTPMNGIIGMANLLSETPLNSRQQDFLNLIRSSGNTLLVLINDILDLSKIKAGKLTIESVSFQPRALLQRLADSFRIRTDAKKIDLFLNIHPHVPEQVSGDPYRLEQILSNLLSNSFKFTDEGFIRLDVSVISAMKGESTIRFSVTDTGIGIPADKLERIFDSFAQAGNDISRKFGGTGLGLAICRNLAELQRGSITVTSKEGSGSLFELQIPYKLVEGKNNLNLKSDQKRNLLYPGKKILIVEDNEINQKVIFHHLERLQICCTIANNGKEAVGILSEQQTFDLIIMDLQMPEMNGFQATTYIRKKLNLQVPIIAMTASVLRDERKKCLEIGMNEYLAKPFSPEDLMRIMNKYLGEDASEMSAENDQNDSSKPYDLELLKEVGEGDFISEVVGLFLVNTPGILHELKNDLLNDQLKDVQQKAHRLKSSVGILKIPGMLNHLSLLETKTIEQEQITEILPLVEMLEAEFQLLKPMLEAEVVKFGSPQSN